MCLFLLRYSVSTSVISEERTGSTIKGNNNFFFLVLRGGYSSIVESAVQSLARPVVPFLLEQTAYVYEVRPRFRCIRLNLQFASDIYP